MNLTITKKIAKQGENLVLIIPRNLHPYLQKGDLVEAKFRLIPSAEKEK